MSSMGRAELGAPTGSSSFHLIGFPILHEGNLVAVPLVDPVVEAGGGGGVFCPLDGAPPPGPCVHLYLFPPPPPFFGGAPPNPPPLLPPNPPSPPPPPPP